MRISQAKAHSGLREQREIDVAYASRGSKFVRRVQYRDRRSRARRSGWGRRIQWIRQQVVVRKLLIATETALQVVPLVLVRPQAQGVVGIASPSETVEVKIVEQQALVIDRLHRKGLVEYSWASLQIHQCVVHIAASAHVVGAVAQLDGGVNLIPAAGYAIRLGRRSCGRGRTCGGSLGEECF